MRRGTVAALVVMALGGSAWAMFMQPTGMPVDRLVANLGQRLKDHPDDARLTYLLGRVHTYAFVFHNRLVPAFAEDSNEPWVAGTAQAEQFQVQIEEDEKALENLVKNGTAQDWQRRRLEELRTVRALGPLTEAELHTHLVEGLRGHLRAIALDPKEPEFHLGLAYLLEQGAAEAPKLDVDPLPAARAEPAGGEASGDTEAPPPEARTPAWRARAETEYLCAFELAAQPDLDKAERPISPGGLRDRLSYEAALGALRLVDARPEHEGDEALRSRLREQMHKIEILPLPKWVTPILFSLTDARPLDALLSDRTAVFDLDGDGRAERWPWLQPDTALLVWDPDATGRVTSGLQLFGSVTWWLFFADGYQALDLLDDDGDGWVAGAELAGLALWQDRDGDGMSDAGEVTPIECTDIDALATRVTGRVGRSLVSEQGLRLRDGRRLPTYDWVTAPAAEP